ncbi:hypothetical protein N7467_004284 [Penicillium canescens]|nr:hypothetical protein N7467_004284 [Penicillium canescens]
MSDSGEPAPLRTRAKRGIAGLSAAQITHKREMDRKAQRAMRQRTKHRIQELESDIAVFKNSFSQREQTMIEEIQVLREQNRQLKFSLESIGQFALGGIPCLPETSLQGATVGANANKQTEPSGNDNMQNIDVSGSQLVGAESSQADHASYFTGVGAPEANCPNTPRNLQSDRPLLTPLAGVFAGPNDAFPRSLSNPHSYTHFSNLHTTHGPGPPSGSPRSVACVLPKHTGATCPLDQILLDFIASRRSMLARGIPSADVLGPEQLSPSDLLNPAGVSGSHAISRVMAEVLTTFPHVNLPEKLAFMYLMHLTTRWQISPNSDSYARMPVWIRPTVMQITIPHAAWIDNIPWPRVRDILIGDPDRYPFAVFSELYSQHVTLNWPYDSEDIVVDTEDGAALNTIFEKHILRLSNWFAPRQFRDYFSEWTSDVYIDE